MFVLNSVVCKLAESNVINCVITSLNFNSFSSFSRSFSLFIDELQTTDAERLGEK